MYYCYPDKQPYPPPLPSQPDPLEEIMLWENLKPHKIIVNNPVLETHGETFFVFTYSVGRESVEEYYALYCCLSLLNDSCK